MKDKLERIVEFYPAYDKRDPDPKKNFGIHGVNLLMVLKGPLGAIQFLVYTNWELPHVREELDARHLSQGIRQIDLDCFYHPTPADIGYHSPKPMYEGQTMMVDSCEWLDGKPCYYDGSGVNAEIVFVMLLKGGSDAVWKELERRYQELFKP